MSQPLVIEVSELANQLKSAQLCIIDLSSEENYQAAHIPGAIHLEPKSLLCGDGPISNKIPSIEKINQLLQRLGISRSSNIVVYDDQKGPWAGRFIWTLHCAGLYNCSFLNGQRQAWLNAGLPLEQTINTPQPTDISIETLDPCLQASLELISERLNDPQLVIWDARSEAEYNGEKIINAKKGGHIPGAKHYEWTDTLHSETGLLLEPQQLRQQLAKQGIDTNKEIISHCQTHRRSGLTYIAARHAGCQNVRCYDGSWFEWGNRPDTPVE